MTDTENREQHNHGSGTFVGGDVHGGIWHVFLPPYGKRRINGQPPREHRSGDGDGQNDDYEDLGGSLLGWSVAACTLALATLREAMGWPMSAGASPPGTAERIVAGLVFFYGFLGCIAAFLARLAQVLEIWSEQCSITAVQSRGRWVARPPATMARAMACLAFGVAAAAEVLASFYGWRSFGGEVAKRAHTARLNAAANAQSARDAANGAKA